MQGRGGGGREGKRRSFDENHNKNVNRLIIFQFNFILQFKLIFFFFSWADELYPLLFLSFSFPPSFAASVCLAYSQFKLKPRFEIPFLLHH